MYFSVLQYTFSLFVCLFVVCTLIFLMFYTSSTGQKCQLTVIGADVKTELGSQLQLCLPYNSLVVLISLRKEKINRK